MVLGPTAAHSEVADERMTGDGSDLYFGAPVETEPMGASFMRRNVELDGLARKAYGARPAAAAEPAPDGSNETLGFFGDERDQILKTVMAEVIAHERALTRKEITAANVNRTNLLANLQIAHDRLLGRCIDLRRDLVKLHRQIASDRREWRTERRLLQDQIAALRKRLDVGDAVERGTIVEVPNWRTRHG
jgi:hypothetical protein